MEELGRLMNLILKLVIIFEFIGFYLKKFEFIVRKYFGVVSCVE